jgi:hypothetical protein
MGMICYSETWVNLLVTYVPFAHTLGHRASWNASFRFNFLILIQSIELLGWGISPSQGRYIHKHRIRTNRHPCLDWDSNPLSQCLCGRRYFMPQITRPLWLARKDYTALYPRSGSACHMLSGCYFARLILRPWRGRWYVRKKRELTLKGLYGVISQKIVLFITTGVPISNPTNNNQVSKLCAPLVTWKGRCK